MGTIGAGSVAVPHEGSGKRWAASEVASISTGVHGKSGIGASFGLLGRVYEGITGHFVDFPGFGASITSRGGIGWVP